jgi:hypothetical protein
LKTRSDTFFPGRHLNVEKIFLSFNGWFFNDSVKEKRMLKRCSSIVLITALVCTLGGTSVFANASSDPEVKPRTLAIQQRPDTATENRTKPNGELRAGMLALIAEAKAGKVAPATRPQTQPATSRNLSKRTKIAIGVGIAVAVVAVILIVNRPRLTGSF